MRLSDTVRAYSPFSVLITLSLLLISTAAQNGRLSAQAQTTSLLHCLGRHATAHADRAKVQAFVQANPNPKDDSVWSQLGPKEWGFKGHQSADGDSWEPTGGGPRANNVRLVRQHRKLIRCAKKLQQDVGQAKPAEKRQQQDMNAEPRALPDMFGGLGFKQLRQDASTYPLRQPVVAANDAQSIAPGSAVPNDSSVQPQPGDQHASPVPQSDQSEQNKASAAAAADGQKPLSDGSAGTPASASANLAPGLGPNTKSLVPASESDPNQQNIPKTVPGTPGASTGSDPPGTATQDMNIAGPGQSPDQNTTPPSSQTSLLRVNTRPLSSPGCQEVRIRKEYSTLSRAEKKSFADAIKCVRSKPSRYQTDPGWNAADDWTLLHIRMVKYVHFTAYFTLFHRGFLAIVERDLNECGFDQGLPWVDWTKTPTDPSTNPLFDADLDYGLGTDGHGDNSDCPWQTGLAVVDGALSDHYFNAPFRHRLCRQFNNLDVKSPNPHFGSNCTTFITPSFVKGLGTTHDNGRFFDFSSALEISTHLSMHTCVGGNLAWLSSSPNDIVFHLHHGCVDNIFGAWQKKSRRNARAFHGPKRQQKGGAHPPWTATRTDMINFEPLAENVMVKDLLDRESGAWGGRMCYRYDYDIDM